MPLIPPEYYNITAAAAIIIPQINFVKDEGSYLPCRVCIPNTNVAESADVIKNVLIKKIANTDRVWTSNTPKAEIIKKRRFSYFFG
jgi:hypothetical protein